MAHPYLHVHKPTLNFHNHPPKLDVVAVLSNTQRYESRYRLFKEFMSEMLHNRDVRLTVVEMAFGHRPHFITPDDNEIETVPLFKDLTSVHLRNHHELWVKECMINIGIQNLPDDWQYVAWIDGDISFVNKDWATETVEALQHYQVVQPWETALDLGPEGSTFQTHTSFCSRWIKDPTSVLNNYPQYPYYGKTPFPHPGYAWAARREAINMMGTQYGGGLLNTAILGAADHHMAYCLIGLGDRTVPKNVTQDYTDAVLQWQSSAKALKKNIGYVPGSILHYWHGKKKDRKYATRWQILVDDKFSPRTDLLMDWQGLWQMRTDDNRQIKLRDDVRKYMRQRNEDSIDES